MNIFVIHSGADYERVTAHISSLKRKIFKLNALVLENGNIFWKLDAAAKIKKSQMVVFYVGKNSHASPYIGWELKTAMKYKKPIYTINLDDENKMHPVLTVVDSFSGQKVQYNTETTEDQLSEMISKYELGDYGIFNEDMEKMDKKILLEQYKLFLKTSEDLVARRQSVNNFYISINSALVTLFGASFTFNMAGIYKLIIGAMFAATGIVLSIFWIRILLAYGNLNGSKMKIISGIERQLPASLYDAEWAAMSDKLNKKKYISFTDNETNIPKIFIVIYSIMFVALVIAAIISYQNAPVV